MLEDIVAASNYSNLIIHRFQPSGDPVADAYFIFDLLLNLVLVLSTTAVVFCRYKIRHNEKMAQIRGTAGYNLGGGVQDRFGGPSRGDATNDPSPLDAIREQTSRIEDWLDTYSDPIKP